MPAIHMNVESLRAVIDLLNGKKGYLEQLIKDLNSVVADLEVGQWQAVSASFFYNDYADLRKDLTTQLNAMGSFAGRLEQAITDYEIAAKHLE
jgi:uncharacterized protein YukE